MIGFFIKIDFADFSRGWLQRMKEILSVYACKFSNSLTHGKMTWVIEISNFKQCEVYFVLISGSWVAFCWESRDALFFSPFVSVLSRNRPAKTLHLFPTQLKCQGHLCAYFQFHFLFFIHLDSKHGVFYSFL